MINTAVFIPVRSNSSRLSKKCYLEILGRPTIEYLIERAKFSDVGPVVICTTNEKEDDRFVDIARKNGVEIFRGSTEDVLGRLLGAAVKYGVDCIVNVDGDDVLCEPLYIRKVKEMFAEKDYDYVAVERLPIGLYPSGMSTRSLKIISRINDEDNTDGWRRFYTKTDIFKCGSVQAPDSHRCDDLRLTLDYEQDFELISEIIKRLGAKGRIFQIDDILKLVGENPGLLRINDAVKEIYWQNSNAKYSTVRLKPDYKRIIEEIVRGEGRGL